MSRYVLGSSIAFASSSWDRIQGQPNARSWKEPRTSGGYDSVTTVLSIRSTILAESLTSMRCGIAPTLIAEARCLTHAISVSCGAQWCARGCALETADRFDTG